MVFKYMDSRLKISGMTKKEASFLNGSTRGLNNGREHFYGSKKKKQKRGFPIKDFGNDGGRRSSPLSIFIRGPQHLNTKEEAKMWIPDKRFRE